MIFFKEVQMQVYYMIDLPVNHMTVIIAESGCNSIRKIENEHEVHRMAQAFQAEENGAIPRIYEPITEEQFFHVYLNVWEVMDADHSAFFQKHFEL
jgi:hypothetical protein